MDEVAVLLVGERRDGGEVIASGQGIDQPPAALLALAPDDEVNPLGLGGGRDLFRHQGGMIAADDDLDLRPDLLEQMGDLDAGVVLPGHGRKPDQVRLDAAHHLGEVFLDRAALADQIDQKDLVVVVDVAADRGDAVIGHVHRGFMDNDRHHVRHGYEQNLHCSVSDG